MLMAAKGFAHIKLGKTYSWGGSECIAGHHPVQGLAEMAGGAGVIVHDAVGMQYSDVCTCQH